MKKRKISNNEVAAALAKEFKLEYDPKTIGTRFTRMKKVAADEAEKLAEASGTTLWDNANVSGRSYYLVVLLLPDFH
jgi:hypothetical protein